MKTSNQLRTIFLEYFQSKRHTVVPSSPLVPYNDATLLFTNAGMVQFKDLFLGLEKRDYTRAVTAQRCVRAGGKHNDLDEVGRTARHHTFFEMLGNFSFGDYFKQDAIAFAWELLTKKLEIPPEKLWITVFQDDDEAAAIWQHHIGITPERIIRCGEKSNFWAMGDTGPCGPCTEIFYDHGPDIAGGPPGSPDEDGDRYVEIWNLVFMQFDRTPEGELKPLPKPSVDTGMGLERLTAVMQGVHNNYDTDIFRLILQKIAKMCGQDTLTHTSMRVIADHIRSCSFLIIDGVLPSNEGRGYVLRRIIRRAIRHGHKLGMREIFFYQLVEPLVATMGNAYPELVKNKARIEQILQQEERQFLKTLDQGLHILEQDIANLKGTIIPGTTIFRLYDTYGFPPDLTNDIARERGLSLDMDGFEHEMTKQRVLSQQASKFAANYQHQLDVETNSEFTGYAGTAFESKVTELFLEAKKVKTLHVGDIGTIVLAHTPFYAESGGQVGDQGVLRTATGVFQVTDTQKRQQSILHLGHVVEGHIDNHQAIEANVDQEKRQATAFNHSATHLLHSALKQILGTHVQQKGSLVAPDRLRFDFSHPSAVTFEQLQAIERIVNQQIRANVKVETHLMSQKDAIASGAEALFGEKYGDQVRVLQMGEFSMELCGGTHVQRTGDIGVFKIIGESGIAAGVRRIEAVTGEAGLDFVAAQQLQLQQLANKFKTNWENVLTKVDDMQNQLKQTQKQIEQLSVKLAGNVSAELINNAKDMNGIPVIIAKVTVTDVKALRDLADQLKSRMPESIILLGAVMDNKANLLACVGKQLTSSINAGELVNQAAILVGGKGGGRPDQAQAGGTEPAKLDEALEAARKWLISKLNTVKEKWGLD
ncbi:MAG: alanine--tRNA ligase [Gammaproteobacteria bacterium]